MANHSITRDRIQAHLTTTLIQRCLKVDMAQGSGILENMLRRGFAGYDNMEIPTLLSIHDEYYGQGDSLLDLIEELIDGLLENRVVMSKTVEGVTELQRYENIANVAGLAGDLVTREKLSDNFSWSEIMEGCIHTALDFEREQPTMYANQEFDEYAEEIDNFADKKLKEMFPKEEE